MPVFEFIAKVILGVLIVAFQGFIEIIAIVITVVVNMVAVIIYTISGFAAFFAAIWELIKAIFSGSWQNIVDAAKGFMNMFIGQFQRSYEILGVIGDALAGVGRLIASGIKQFLDTIAGFVGQFSDSGRKLVEAFADGIGQSFDKAKDKVRDGLDSIRRMLPFSDAKEGPLSTLTLSGRRFSETFASGIRKGAVAIQTAASDALGGLGGGVITSTVSGAPTAVPAALERTGAINSQAPNIDIHIGTLIGGDDASMRSLAVQLAQMVDQALKGQGVDKVTGLRPS
jgi:phage-related protein